MIDEQWAREHAGTTPSVGGCGTSYHDERGDVQDCTSVEPCRACLRQRIAQLEAQRGGEDPWKPSGCEYDPMIHSSRDAAKWADLFVATFPGLADKRDTMLGWFANAMMAMHDSIKQERGGAVVVPEYPENSFDVRMAVQKAGGMADFDQGIFRAGWELLASRIQPIPADRVLTDGMVGVDRARLAALEAISDKIEALALGPDGRAWTPLHYREFARGELHRAQQAKGE